VLSADALAQQFDRERPGRQDGASLISHLIQLDCVELSFGEYSNYLLMIVAS
jgi:hypothetical protein